MAYRTTVVSPLFPSSRAKDGLRLVAKCYVPECANPNGVTLLFFHCAGSHKDSWEPTIDHIFSAKSAGGKLPAVREAWSFDMHSHGEAAIINGATLEAIGSPLTVEEWADGVKQFVASGVLKGHKFLGVGHSLGGTTLLLTTMSDSDKLPAIKYDGIVLVEPSLITREAFDANLEEREGALRDMSEAISKRRDTWPSREDAHKYLQKRLPWVMWDPRVLQLYVLEYGSYSVRIPLTLCCNKVQERASYLHVEPHFVVLNVIRDLPPSIPLHFVLGGRVDLVPEYIHESVINLTEVASVQKVPDGGHFVVQENPHGLAAALTEILTRPPAASSKAML
ncbi:alpha/beta-hydrolase [Trametes sanguinea]|nr:alpha/beta-hydrolase [Trametes sanguinea]